MVGQRLLHYEILEKLGEGGMGVVYKARDTRLGRLVAIKVLRPDATANSERKQRFVQEARTASALNHSGIVTVHDIAEAEGMLFIVMEYIAGRTLHALIGRKGLEIADALNYSIQLTNALSKAHAAGVVHRDLKPANIMVIDGQVKILDFGVAKLLEAARADAQMTDAETATLSVTQEGTMLGTVAYMSPEQAEGKPVDGRSDVFSFGAVLYEMVAGQRAFRGDTNISILSAILRGEPPPMSEVSPGVPRDLEKIIVRCLRKDPARRFQNILDVSLALEDIRQEYDTGTLAARPPVAKPYRRYLLAGALLVAIVAVALVFNWLGRRQTLPIAASLTRLTSDSGLSDFPALSPDGKLLAYASDRAGQSNLDLWIKQVPGGEPIRLTRNLSDEYDAAFSPDGTRLVYRSEQDGGGIYVIPALGGEPSLLVKRGRSPRFSADGGEILYRATDSADDLWGQIYVVPSTGGVPRQIQSQFPIALTPIWTPDGKHILFLGAPKHDLPDESFDWWVAPVAGGTPRKTGLTDVLKKQNLKVWQPGFWVPGADRVVFSAGLGGDWNIWQLRISQSTWRIDSPAQKLTSGTSEQANPVVAGGRLAFSSLVWNTDIWAAALDANTGKAVGELQRLTQDAANDLIPFVSADGTRVVFTSDRGHNNSGKFNAWLKDLRSGREMALTFNGDTSPFFPIITLDGSKVAYRRESNPKSIYVVSADGGAPEKICDDCGQPRGWSPDRRSIICQKGGPLIRLLLLDTATRKSAEFLRHTSASLYAAQFSPDGRWVAFGARFKPGDERLFIVPASNGAAPQDDAQWIPVTSGPALDNKPRWSADGNLLYFTSDRDEFNCVWAQRLDRATKRPVGAAFPVLHFHGAVRSFAKSGSLKLDISVARDKLVFHLDDVRGNIWMTQMPND